ncbi:MAG: alpha/beta fold hydrolase [Promethearchaeota archaeon]|jgi:pimeloyl-ACP methyl ester carboxylesterase
MQNIIFIHGLESSGHRFKGRFLKTILPDILTPDFKKADKKIPMYELLNYRMVELNAILNSKKQWIMIGSSFGGLMASLYTLQNPSNVKQLILLAPFIVSRKLRLNMYKPVDVPVTVYHGKNDTTVRYKPTRERAQHFFSNLEYNIVDDDHFLHKTVTSINWKKLILDS